jgi:hypothetical protein
MVSVRKVEEYLVVGEGDVDRIGFAVSESCSNFQFTKLEKGDEK